MNINQKYYKISKEVVNAIERDFPVVALESTVITHGLPYPQNLQIAQEMEDEVRRAGAIPATIALRDGVINVGLSAIELEQLATLEDAHKISSRDIVPAIAKGWSGGTTVAGTLLIAHKVGLKIFATGGIGGVHRILKNGKHTKAIDISADLLQLSRTPLIVVCAGAKAILDLPATLEYLETNSIPVIGYRTDEFPAFYSRTSGLKVSVRVDTLDDIVSMAKANWDFGMHSALLVVNPLPEEDSVDPQIIELAVEQALAEAEDLGVTGQDVTPYLLSKVSQLTEGKSLSANLKLLRNNAYLAGKIASDL